MNMLMITVTGAGMTSACMNPVLYGFLNGNFKKEFEEMDVCAILNRKEVKMLCMKENIYLYII